MRKRELLDCAFEGRVNPLHYLASNAVHFKEWSRLEMAEILQKLKQVTV
jgi:hypothetical protein